jgi:tetratricopeptide (TPR) repeat protein
LLWSGRFAQAQAATKRALDLLPPGHRLRPRAVQQLQQCEQLLKLDARLSAILKGEAQPTDTLDRLQLADLCLRYKKRYHDAVRFYTEAFSSSPQLTPVQQAPLRYNAACAAVLAAAGQGMDAEKLDPKEKARLRQQALGWLREYLQRGGGLWVPPPAWEGRTCFSRGRTGAAHLGRLNT